MSVSWVELLRRAGVSLDSLGEALYDTDVAGLSRVEAPPWLAAGPDKQLRFRRLARAAVDRLAPIEDDVLERLLDAEGKLREQLDQQAQQIKELQRRLEDLGAL